jgi:ATP-dependent 26S proteasome regulatory subunit
VGKTALCRVVAAELPAGTTIVLVDSAMGPRSLSALYDAIGDLAPAAVFLDDIDLIAGNRARGSAGATLGEFLTRLDGFRPPTAVITVATTNVTDALDPALLRPGRFDAIVEIGPPDAAARAQILHRYLDPVRPLDVGPVVASTVGATGADLREIVRRAVLERGTLITTEHLVEIARSGRWKPTPSTGQYL